MGQEVTWPVGRAAWRAAGGVGRPDNLCRQSTGQAEGASVPRSVLVTGGNRGIGLAIATAFASNGDNVAITHRGSAVPDGMLGVRCDVTDAKQVDAAFAEIAERHGPVEVLVSNAGITDDTLLLRMSEEQFTRVLDANLTGAYRVAKAAARGMLRKRWGRMIFISSVVAMSGSAGQVNYAASKSGLIGLARSLARELGSRSITANVVLPGFITTDMTDALPDDVREQALSRIPSGRYGSSDEIAAAVTFLASDAAGYVNGAALPVDGGLGMGL
jgi:NAD(P)-dependent dehydrogenase (short-subunit alcohol dehydrogenase family)